MASKFVAFSALVASAAAFAPATPSLRAARTGATSLNMAVVRKEGRAPVITIFDHRGCSRHQNKEYKGTLTGGQDDEMCVKVGTAKIPFDKDQAEAVLQAALNGMQK